MKTISIAPGRFHETQKLISGRPPIGRANRTATWLPAPTVPRRAGVQPSTSAKARRNLWIPLESDGLAEKALFALLVIVAVAAIGFGFSSLLDMVQGWGAFNSWVAQVVH